MDGPPEAVGPGPGAGTLHNGGMAHPANRLRPSLAAANGRVAGRQAEAGPPRAASRSPGPPAAGAHRAQPAPPHAAAGPGGAPHPAPDADPARLFIALWPSTAEQAALARWIRGGHWPAGAALVRPERLHLTLHFLGPVARARLPQLLHGLTTHAAAPVPAVVFGAPALWPRGLAVLTVAASPALAGLQARLGHWLQALGLPTERRPFRPHVTLARRASGAHCPDGPAPPTWQPRGPVLVETRPDGGYRVLGP